MMAFLYHIADREQWLLAQRDKTYKHRSLALEGFIHCSEQHQLEQTANRYFRECESILILIIDPAKLNVVLKYEPASSGELFPHVYGPINVTSVIGSREVMRGQDGYQISFP